MVEHYYTKKQTSKFEPFKITVKVKGQEIELWSSAGVFSKKNLDIGSKVLIENTTIKKGQRVLDLGCGYGVVGIAVMKQNPEVEMVFTDSNARAQKLVKKNLRLNKLDGTALCGDVFEKIKGKFDVILLNPPQTAGKKLCFRMIEESALYLEDGGSLQIVARHKKGGKELEKKMKEVFGNVEQVAKKSGFRVYISVKK